MIFITTGSTPQSSYYRPMIETIERLIIEGEISEPVYVQAGHGYYESSHFKEMIDYAPDLSFYIKEADLIITADGAGTIFNLLDLGKKIIVVDNKLAARYGAPAKDFIGGFEKDGYLLWCKNFHDIYETILAAKSFEFKVYDSPKNDIASTIQNTYLRWKKNENIN